MVYSGMVSMVSKRYFWYKIIQMRIMMMTPISGRIVGIWIKVWQYKNPLLGRILAATPRCHRPKPLSSATTGSTGPSSRPSWYRWEETYGRMVELSNHQLNWCYQRVKTGFLALVDRWKYKVNRQSWSYRRMIGILGRKLTPDPYNGTACSGFGVI